MAKRHSLAVEARTLFGNKVKQLRRDGFIPANIYGHNVESTAVSVDGREFMSTFRMAGETGLVDLKISSESAARPVLIHSMLKDPVTGAILHVDFYQVNLKEKLTAAVPLHFTGESPLVKTKEGILLELMQEVEVESLPTDIPSSIEVDTSSIVELDGGIFVRDLPLPTGVEMQTDGDEMVCKVAPAQMEEEPEEVAEAQAGEAEEESATNEEASGNE